MYERGDESEIERKDQVLSWHRRAIAGAVMASCSNIRCSHGIVEQNQVQSWHRRAWQLQSWHQISLLVAVIASLINISCNYIHSSDMEICVYCLLHKRPCRLGSALTSYSYVSCRYSIIEQYQVQLWYHSFFGCRFGIVEQCQLKLWHIREKPGAVMVC